MSHRVEKYHRGHAEVQGIEVLSHMERNDFSSSCLDYEDWFLAVYDPKFYQPYQFKEVDEP